MLKMTEIGKRKDNVEDEFDRTNNLVYQARGFKKH